MLTIHTNVTVRPDWPSTFHYHSYNVAASIAMGGSQLTSDPVGDNYQPRTALGRRLITLRRAHVLEDVTLLGWDEIDQEVRARRGGRSDA